MGAFCSQSQSYSAGSTAIFSVKYTADRGAFKEDDTVFVSVPTEVASKVRFSVDPLHFSSVTDKGDGMWELVFGANASAALAGSFSMHITTAEVTTQTSAPVTVGSASKNLIVIPKGSASGVGTYTDAIMKDANDGNVSYGGYDYSKGVGDDAAQIGVYDSTKDTNIGYRLFVNNKRATMDHITVVDTLPDGMTFDRTKGIEVTDSSGKTVDASLYSVSISGQELTFSYPGTLGDSLAISYWVDALGGTNIKYTNHAEIYYQSGGTAYREHRNYVLQGNDYNAACGEKSVGKTVDGAAPKDGQVFTFPLCDEQGNVLQEKTNDGQTVTFDKIAHSEDDLGADGSDASRHYTVKDTVDLPKTDDSPWTLVAGAVLAGSAALTIAMATLRRRGTETSEKKRSRARS